MSMFSGFMSRWKIPFLCMWSIAAFPNRPNTHQWVNDIYDYLMPLFALNKHWDFPLILGIWVDSVESVFPICSSKWSISLTAELCLYRRAKNFANLSWAGTWNFWCDRRLSSCDGLEWARICSCPSARKLEQVFRMAGRCSHSPPTYICKHFTLNFIAFK